MDTNTQRQAAFRQRMKEQGIAQITVWAPIRDRERIKTYAARLRKAWEKETGDAGSKER
ncbi:MAG: hypothetical protein K9L88_07705 [Chromatiaceae bacterium]|nr:hypothetical protein [Chromatiaceae bacterium]